MITCHTSNLNGAGSFPIESTTTCDVATTTAQNSLGNYIDSNILKNSYLNYGFDIAIILGSILLAYKILKSKK